MKITFSTEIKDGSIIKHAYFGAEDYYVKFSDKYKDEIEGCEDPFAMMLIFRMMREGGDIHICGQVSKSLLANLELFAAYWNLWMPRLYKKISITADEEFDDYFIAQENKAIACFSAGLDACAMLYRHKNNMLGRNNKNIERALFIWGADIPLKARKIYDDKFAAAKEICDDLGVELVPAETNYRRYMSYYNMEYMAVMFGIMRFWKNYPFQMLASSFDVSAPWVSTWLPWGSNPVSDFLLTSNRYTGIVSDYDLTRTEKASLIRNWQTGLKNLKVCWRPLEGAQNCGTCEKCIRTYFNFKAIGAQEIPFLNNDVTKQHLTNFEFEHCVMFYDEIISVAKENNIWSDLFGQLEKKVNRQKRKNKFKETFSFIPYYRLKFLETVSTGKKKQHYRRKLYDFIHGKDPVNYLHTRE